MRGLLTTQSQNCYKEQIQRELLTRLAWKSRYAKLYPSALSLQGSTQLPPLPPGARKPEKQNPPPHPQSLAPTMEKERRQPAPPLMKPVPPPPQSRRAMLQDSSHHQGIGRSLYLQRRGHIRPEEKFDFPLLSSWDYGWRLGDFTLDYRTPSHARSAVVEKTFYSKNGVFRNPSATDSMG
ncbi:protein SPMIP1 [Oryzias latipes]